jgi:hypothetical protein
MQSKVDVLNRVKLSLKFENYRRGKVKQKVDVLNRVKIFYSFIIIKQ